jgi:hypothetical protein
MLPSFQRIQRLFYIYFLARDYSKYILNIFSIKLSSLESVFNINSKILIT